MYSFSLRTLLLVCVSILFFAACENDNTSSSGDVELNFRAEFDSQPLQIFDVAYPYPEGMSMKFQLFQFYLSDIELVRADATTVPLSEVELVRFQDFTTLAEAEQGVTLQFTDVPDGEYTAIRFGLGVNPTMNALDPTNFQQPHPLDDTNYWSWATGYVFSKIEASVDTLGNGAFDTGVSYHVGNDSLYTIMTYQRPLNVRADQSNRMSFSVDVQDVLIDNGNYLDFRKREEQLVHANKPHIHSFLWRNLESALQMEQ